MAERLISPADFAAPGKKCNLLPPSSFTTSTGSKPLPPNPWKDLSEANAHIQELKEENAKLRSRPVTDETLEKLAQATTEIVQLKVENKRLLDEKHAVCKPPEFAVDTPGQEQQPLHGVRDIREFTVDAPVSPNQPPRMMHPQVLQAAPPVVHGPSLNHMDEIIQRQAADIASLKDKLRESETALHKSQMHFESEQAVSQARHVQEIAVVHAELTRVKQQHSQQLHDQDHELNKNLQEKDKIIDELEDALRQCKGKWEEEVTSLKNKVAEVGEELADRSSSLAKIKKSQTSERDMFEEQLTQMRTYIAGVETSCKSSGAWKRQVDQLTSRLSVKDEEASGLRRQLELLSARLQALERILQVQEDELSKVKGESTVKKKEVLLTRWRERVWELMVQGKSSELNWEQQERDTNSKIVELAEHLDAARGEVRLQVAALEERDVASKLAQHTISNLEVEVTRAQDIAVALDEKLQHQKTILLQLSQFIQGIQEKYNAVHDQFMTVDSALQAFDQRISFAGGRIFMLQGQFRRREALLKLNQEDGEQEKKQSQGRSETVNVEIRFATLQEELSRVTDERDALCRQQQEDARLLEFKVSAARQKVDADVQELKDHVSSLNVQFQQKNEEIEELQKQVALTADEASKLRAQLEEAHQQAATAQAQAQEGVESTLAAERIEMREALTEMEQRLSEARREQTKAVVSLRHLERATARDKERAREELLLREREYNESVSQLERKLQNLEKDRNVLMVTLRQAGLVGQYKAQREPPILDHDLDQEPVSVKPSILITTTANSEPLHSVIDDLKSLTADVMEIEEDSS